MGIVKTETQSELLTRKLKANFGFLMVAIKSKLIVYYSLDYATDKLKIPMV